MKTPINGARLSSGFGMRRHPILGYSRMHRGTDFAAPYGTPILAAGDGVVRAPAAMAATATTSASATANTKRPTRTCRATRAAGAGARVQQGQVIGYVGSTGASTGPHLHYEVLLRGRQINPMSLRVATGRNLTGLELQLFEAERARINRLREMRDDEGAQTAQGADARSLR